MDIDSGVDEIFKGMSLLTDEKVEEINKAHIDRRNEMAAYNEEHKFKPKKYSNYQHSNDDNTNFINSTNTALAISYFIG